MLMKISLGTDFKCSNVTWKTLKILNKGLNKTSDIKYILRCPMKKKPIPKGPLLKKKKSFKPSLDLF